MDPGPRPHPPSDRPPLMVVRGVLRRTLTGTGPRLYDVVPTPLAQQDLLLLVVPGECIEGEARNRQPGLCWLIGAVTLPYSGSPSLLTCNAPGGAQKAGSGSGAMGILPGARGRIPGMGGHSLTTALRRPQGWSGVGGGGRRDITTLSAECLRPYAAPEGQPASPLS